jgi:hypothetical protein
MGQCRYNPEAITTGLVCCDKIAWRDVAFEQLCGSPIGAEEFLRFFTTATGTSLRGSIDLRNRTLRLKLSHRGLAQTAHHIGVELV